MCRSHSHRHSLAIRSRSRGVGVMLSRHFRSAPSVLMLGGIYQVLFGYRQRQRDRQTKRQTDTRQTDRQRQTDKEADRPYHTIPYHTFGWVVRIISLQGDSRIRTICMSRLGLICWVGIENHNLERQHQSLSGLAFRAGSANTNSGRQQN